MIQTNGNILDLLVGVMPSETSDARPGLFTPETGDVSFSGLLEEFAAMQVPGGAARSVLLGSQSGLPNETTSALSTPAEEPESSVLHSTSPTTVPAINSEGAVDTDAVEAVDVPTNVTVNAGSIARPTADPVLPTRISLGSHDVAIPESIIDKAGMLSMPTLDKAAADTQIETAGLSLRPEMIPFTDLPELTGLSPRMQARLTDIPDGNYIVSSARVQNNRLELVVQSPQGSSDPITLSLPVDTLDDLAVEAGVVRGNAMSTATGTNTLATNQNGLDLSALLAKLQVTELQVSRTDSNANVAANADDALESAETLLLDLSVRKNNTPQIIRREIRRSQLDARTTSTNSTSAPVTAPVDKTIRQPLMPSALPKISTPLQSGTGAQTLWNRPLTIGSSDLTAKTAGDTMEWPTAELSAGGTNSTVSNELPMTTRISRPTVRFTLPDNIGQRLHPGGRAVTIAIDPEHLGPARLRLSMSNNVLTARMTVDSSAARSMVEGSLQQLTDQLARAGIKVDMVQVNVAGGDANPHNFQHRADRGHYRAQSRLSDNELAELNGRPSAEVITTTIPNRVGASGVNLYA